MPVKWLCLDTPTYLGGHMTPTSARFYSALFAAIEGLISWSETMVPPTIKKPLKTSYVSDAEVRVSGFVVPRDWANLADVLGSVLFTHGLSNGWIDF